MVTIYLLGCTIVCIFLYFTKGIFWGRNRKDDEPPIVPGHPLLGNGQQFNDNSVQFILDSQKKYGDVFSMRMLYYYMTVIADPHSFEAFSREKSFDFDPIQEQVNGNIFGFQIPESRNMIKFIGKTTRGSAIPRNLHNFSNLLEQSFSKLELPSTDGWNVGSLDCLANKTLFQTIFNSIFGADKESPTFNYELFHDNFHTFHKYFSYLWLGLPHCLFPEATKAVGKMVDQPTSAEFMASECTSEYLKSAIEYLKSYNLSEKEIVCHNLVFLHINVNTFKIATWCLYELMANRPAMAAVRQEVEDLIEASKDMESSDGDEATITAKDIEKMEVLDSLVKETFRMSSGVFMIRHNQNDVNFTVQTTGQTYRIRRGDKVMMYPPAIHKDPEIFEDPETFKYDRFIGQTFYKNGLRLKNPLLSFGSLCPGRKIALLQTKWYLISMLHKFDMELVEGESCDFDTSYPGHEIVPPTNDVQIRYKARNSSISLHAASSS